MLHEPTLNCLLKLESTIVNFNLTMKSFHFCYFIKLSTRLYRSYTCTYNIMCGLWLENLQIYNVSYISNHKSYLTIYIQITYMYCSKAINALRNIVNTFINLLICIKDSLCEFL